MVREDVDGELKHRYTHGPMVDQVLVDEDLEDGFVNWLVPNHQGSIRHVIRTDGEATVTADIDYDAFGNVTSEDRPEDVDLLLGYTGQQYDQETGLSYYKARYYDPATGRFLSEDPLGFAAGDPNLYRYVGNSPTNFTDPSGQDYDDWFSEYDSYNYDVDYSFSYDTSGSSFDDYSVDYSFASSFSEYDASYSYSSGNSSSYFADDYSYTVDYSEHSYDTYVPDDYAYSFDSFRQEAKRLEPNFSVYDDHDLQTVRDARTLAIDWINAQRQIDQNKAQIEVLNNTGEQNLGEQGFFPFAFPSPDNGKEIHDLELINNALRSDQQGIVERLHNFYGHVHAPADRIFTNASDSIYTPEASGAGLIQHTLDELQRGHAFLQSDPVFEQIVLFGTSLATRPLMAAAEGYAASTAGRGVPWNANFAQNTYSEVFSAKGRFGGQTINEVTAALRGGKLGPADVSIDIIDRGAGPLILNTRSAEALQRAGIPRSVWIPVDRTGVLEYEMRLSNQLRANFLTPAGTPVAVPKTQGTPWIIQMNDR